MRGADRGLSHTPYPPYPGDDSAREHAQEFFVLQGSWSEQRASPTVLAHKELRSTQKAKCTMATLSRSTLFQNLRASHLSLLSLAAASLLAAGCGGAVDGTPVSNPNAVTGPSFVVGTDVPLAGVTSFSVQIESIDAVTASGTSVPLLSGTPTVDFARFNGLQTLLDHERRSQRARTPTSSSRSAPPRSAI